MRALLVTLFLLVATTWADETWGPLPSDETLRVIRNAREVYVFPYTTSVHPRRDDRHLRALDRLGRDTLKRLLGHQQNWFVGFIDSAEPVGVRDVGALFRTKTDELVLFFDTDTISATFRGRWYGGGLISKRVNDLYKWKKRYARLELEGK
jgi:hypothetical protein